VFYWFGEHKIAGEAGNVAHVGVHCYTSTDLYNWKDAGIALAVRMAARKRRQNFASVRSAAPRSIGASS
jgi:hypothetical protein